MTADRRDRLRRVIRPVLDLDAFTADHVSELAADYRGYVTRTLNLMVDARFLRRETIDGDDGYRWESSTKRREFSLDAWIENEVAGDQVKARPENERPREKLARLGVEQLTVADLLAILIRSGIRGESAIEGGQRLANRFADDLASLPDQSVSEIRDVTRAVNVANYAQIMAGIELGRRVAAAVDVRDANRASSITSTGEAIAYCARRFARLAADGHQEEFWVVTLDTKHKPVGHHRVTVGTLDASLVHPREVFRVAIRDAAAAVVLAHNHPSGDPTPSREDFAVTDRLTEAGRLIGITVLDHIVVARQRCVSIREEA